MTSLTMCFMITVQTNLVIWELNSGRDENIANNKVYLYVIFKSSEIFVKIIKLQGLIGRLIPSN